MRIGFAKFGKSIKFVSPHTPHGGDIDAPMLLQILANNNPDVTFDIIGRSDLDRVSKSEYDTLFPYGNVISSILGYKFKTNVNSNDAIFNCLGDNKIDHAVIMDGTLCSVNVMDLVMKRTNLNEPSKVLEMANKYSSFIVHWLNVTKTPYVEIICDPRYIIGGSMGRDIFHRPHTALSQYNYKYKFKHIKNYDDQVELIEGHMPVKYAGIETLFCYHASTPKTPNIEPKHNMSIILNEGNPSRYPMLKEWILDRMNDVNVYGHWVDESVKSDKRFVGTCTLTHAQSVVADSKYTFIIPIRRGWVTSKYIEMIHAGCIPFMHPTYDEQDHLKFPKILRPKTPDDMMETISYLNSRDDERLNLINDLQKKYCRPELYDGSYVNDMVMKSLIPSYVKPDINKFTKNKPANFSEYI